MESISLIGGVLGVVLIVANIALRQFVRPSSLLRLYGPSGLLLGLFGSRTTWRVEAQVLGQLDDEIAMNFRKSVQDECTMISVAAAIAAQIAITALSLDWLSQTHWVVKGFLMFSLTSALMAVYYATTQQRTLGRLLSAAQVSSHCRSGIGLANLPEIYAFRGCDPEELDPAYLDHFGPYDSNRIKYFIMRCCFSPSIASVITMSAPQMLLSASLVALLLALGIYLGFIWTRSLDTAASLHDSRNVFIMYIAGLVVCFLVYDLTQLILNEDPRPEENILEDYVMEYVHKHPEMLQRLDIRLVEHERQAVFVKVVR